MNAALLARTVRLTVAPNQPGTPSTNTWAANPDCSSVGATFALTAVCEGPLSNRPGLVIDIGDVDRVIRDQAPDLLSQALADSTSAGHQVIEKIGRRVNEHLSARLVHLQWDLSPWSSIIWETASMGHATLVRQYNFAAAHRLHDPSLDDDANEQLFGKCARPGGHGHNYLLEVHVAIPVDAPASPNHAIDEIVERLIIERFDHRHLNCECAEFEELNPTVENIARVCWNLLADELSALGTPRQVRVWETDRTWAAFPAQAMAIEGA